MESGLCTPYYIHNIFDFLTLRTPPTCKGGFFDYPIPHPDYLYSRPLITMLAELPQDRNTTALVFQPSPPPAELFPAVQNIR